GDERLREKALDFYVRAAPVEVHLLAVPITLSDIFVRETVPLERLAHPPSCISITIDRSDVVALADGGDVPHRAFQIGRSVARFRLCARNVVPNRPCATG